MKAINYIIAASLFVCVSIIPVSAQTYAYANSPDHPKTWVSGAAKTHLALGWDCKRNMLVAHVTYSTQLWASNGNNPETEDYTLSFPDVQFNPQDNTFTSNGVTVARLHHTFIGDDIVLEKGFDLSVHRHDGLIFGAIIPSRES
jgi:hypothetical protein